MPVAVNGSHGVVGKNRAGTINRDMMAPSRVNNVHLLDVAVGGSVI